MMVINLWGGPGIGKSTMASLIYAWLKERGCRAELTGEYAKDLIYEDSMRAIHDQLYVYANQEHRLHRLEETGIQVAVSDSPTPLGILYDPEQDEKLAELIWNRFDRYRSVNLLMRRNEDMFTEKDRIHSLEEAKKIDDEIAQMLQDHEIAYMEINMMKDNPWADVEMLLTNIFAAKSEKNAA